MSPLFLRSFSGDLSISRLGWQVPGIPRCCSVGQLVGCRYQPAVTPPGLGSCRCSSRQCAALMGSFRVMLTSLECSTTVVCLHAVDTPPSLSPERGYRRGPPRSLSSTPGQPALLNNHSTPSGEETVTLKQMCLVPTKWSCRIHSDCLPVGYSVVKTDEDRHQHRDELREATQKVL